MNGWKPCKTFTMVNWVRARGGDWWLLVPILGEAV